MARKNTDYTNIPKEKFEFFDRSEAIHDKNHVCLFFRLEQVRL